MTETGLATRPAPDPGAALAGAARGGALNLAGAATGALAGFAVTWLVARELGPGRAGGFFAACAAFTILTTVAKLGAETGLVYFIARLRAFRAGPDELRRCLRTALTPVTVVSLALAVALGRVGPAPLRVLAVFVPLAALSDTLLAATRGLHAMRPTVLLEKVLRPLAQVVLLVVLGSRLSTLAWALPYLPTAILAGYAVHRRLRVHSGQAAGPGPVSGYLGGFWRFTAPRALASTAQLALGRLDILLLAGMAGLRAAALYAVASRFIVVGQLANQAIAQAVQPRLAELLATGDRAGARALYQTATGWLVLAAWPVYLGVALLSPMYLALFGPAYRQAGPIVLTLALAMLVATGCGMVDMVLSMAGRTRWNLYNVAVAFAVNLALDLVLIPRLGALGAALGLAASILANNLIPLAQVAVRLGLHPFGRGTLVAAGLALLCLGALPLAARLSTMDACAAATGAGAAGYLIAALRLRRVLYLDAFFALRRQG
jgi:O-antigen/teichoic acid export membrane protein